MRCSLWLSSFFHRWWSTFLDFSLLVWPTLLEATTTIVTPAKSNPISRNMGKKWTTVDIPTQTGKIALVTGATSGLGYETALALAQAGATVIVCGRNEEKGQNALRKILALCPTAKVEFGKVDQSSLASVAEFAASIIAKYPHLDILINNAGTKPPTHRQTTNDGFEIGFQTNFLSHFALTSHLLELLRKSSSPRVINVGSLTTRFGHVDFNDLQKQNCSYGLGIHIYTQSKLAIHLFSLELQRRSDAGGWGIMSIAAHPGASKTEIFNERDEPWRFSTVANWVTGLFSQSAAEGALPQLFAATSPDAKPNVYYGPGGFLELTGEVCPCNVPRVAKDEIVGAKLWNVSTELAKVSWPG